MSSIKDAYNTVRQLGKFQAALAQLEPALKDVADLEGYRDELQRAVVQLKTDVERCKAALADAESAVASKSAERARLDAAVGELKSRLKAFIG